MSRFIRKRVQTRLVLTIFFLTCMVLVPVIQTSSQIAAQAAHPRLFFLSGDIPTLRTQAASTHQDIWIAIRDYVAGELGVPAPVTAPGVTEQGYVEYGNRLIPMAFACVISERTDLCDLARDYLVAYAGWTEWDESGQRGRGHAHMLMGSAIAFDWLNDYLTPTERDTVRDSLAYWANALYAASVAGHYDSAWHNWWPKSYMQNYYWIIYGALGMAGLSLQGETLPPTLSANVWVQHAHDKFVLGGYLLENIADGSWHESISYQNAVVTMMLPFMTNLRRLTGEDILPHTYLQNYANWRLYNHLPGTTFYLLSYGDMNWSYANTFRPQNVLRFVAAEYNNGYAEWLAQQLIATDGRLVEMYSAPWYTFEFLYYDPAVTPLPPDSLPRYAEFADSESVIWRTGWADDDLIFGLKSGAYGGRFAYETFVQGLFPWESPCAITGCSLNAGHDHDDTNGFYLYGSGNWLAPETVGVLLYETSHHNTLLIDGSGQYRPPDPDAGNDPATFINRDGFLEATVHTPGMDYVASDATRRYAVPDLTDYTRHVVFVRPTYFVILDHLAAAAPHRYEFTVHFSGAVSLDGDWIRGEAGGGLVLGVGIVAPQAFQVMTGDDGQPYARDYAVTPEANSRLVHVLFPTYDAQWDARPDASILADSGTAAVVRVAMTDGSVDDTLIYYAGDPAPSKAGPYRFDGRIAIVSTTAVGTLQKVIFSGGTRLESTERDAVLAANLFPDGSYEILYQDTLLAILGDVRSGARFYAPGVEQVTVNHLPVSFWREGAYIVIGESETADDGLADDTEPPDPEVSESSLPTTLPFTGYPPGDAVHD